MTFTLSAEELKPMLAQLLSTQTVQPVSPDDIETIRDAVTEDPIELIEIQTADTFTLIPPES